MHNGRGTHDTTYFMIIFILSCSILLSFAYSRGEGAVFSI